MNTIIAEEGKITLSMPEATDGHVSWVMNKLLNVLEQEAKITHKLIEGSSFPTLEGRIGKRVVFSTNLIPCV